VRKGSEVAAAAIKIFCGRDFDGRACCKLQILNELKRRMRWRSDC